MAVLQFDDAEMCIVRQSDTDPLSFESGGWRQKYRVGYQCVDNGNNSCSSSSSNSSVDGGDHQFTLLTMEPVTYAEVLGRQQINASIEYKNAFNVLPVNVVGRVASNPAEYNNQQMGEDAGLDASAMDLKVLRAKNMGQRKKKGRRH